MLTSREVCIDSVAGGPREMVRGAGSTDGAIDLGWLGQAGFLVQTAGHVVLIDPYLSDSLAKKYRGQEFSYERLMPVPISIAEIGRIDAVLCTHRHRDHMDPETLAAVTARHPACRFVVPAAELNHALAIGLPAERVLPIDAGQSLSLGEEGRAPHDLVVTAVAAAHETLERDDSHRHRFLGYVIETEGLAVYHSGDTVVYPGLAENLAGLSIDLALLPVNGRDAQRTSRGVPGNMTADEALRLCNAVGIPLLVPHHFGMFAFNTASPADLDLLRSAGRSSPGQAAVRAVLPDLDHHLRLQARQSEQSDLKRRPAAESSGDHVPMTP